MLSGRDRRRTRARGSADVHEGVALFGGAATVPELRRRGLQAALLEERMRYAADHGCDLAMMVAEAGAIRSATPSARASAWRIRG